MLKTRSRKHHRTRSFRRPGAISRGGKYDLDSYSDTTSSQSADHNGSEEEEDEAYFTPAEDFPGEELQQNPTKAEDGGTIKLNDTEADWVEVAKEDEQWGARRMRVWKGPGHWSSDQETRSTTKTRRDESPKRSQRQASLPRADTRNAQIHRDHTGSSSSVYSASQRSTPSDHSSGRNNAAGRKIYSMANTSIGIGVSGIALSDSGSEIYSQVSGSNRDHPEARSSLDSGRTTVTSQARAVGQKTRKRVSFQLVEHDGINVAPGSHSPISSLQREFPLNGGILKVPSASAAGDSDSSVLIDSSREFAPPNANDNLGRSNRNSLSSLTESPRLRQLIEETAPHLGLTAEELTSEICPRDEDTSDDPATEYGADGISNEDSGDLGDVDANDTPTSEDETDCQESGKDLDAYINYVGTAKKQLYARGTRITPVLRSSKERQTKTGPRLNLRQAFQQLQVVDNFETGGENIRRAMRKFEGASEALKLELDSPSQRSQKPETRTATNLDAHQSQQGLRKDSHQPSEHGVDERRDSLESDIEEAVEDSLVGRALTCPTSSAGASLAAVHGSDADSASSYPTGSDTSSYKTPPTSVSSSLYTNFSRPLALAVPRPSNPILKYADSSRLEHSRHNAWTIRRLAMTEKRGSTINRPRQQPPRLPPIIRPDAEWYWRTQDELLRILGYQNRFPSRVPGAPSECSTCFDAGSTLPRRQIHDLRRRLRQWWMTIKEMSPSRRLVQYRKADQLLKKFPRRQSGNSRRSDGPLKRHGPHSTRTEFRHFNNTNRRSFLGADRLKHGDVGDDDRASRHAELFDKPGASADDWRSEVEFRRRCAMIAAAYDEAYRAPPNDRRRTDAEANGSEEVPSEEACVASSNYSEVDRFANGDEVVPNEDYLSPSIYSEVGYSQAGGSNVATAGDEEAYVS